MIVTGGQRPLPRTPRTGGYLRWMEALEQGFFSPRKSQKNPECGHIPRINLTGTHKVDVKSEIFNPKANRSFGDRQ